jgi:hypothetical protein
VEGEEFEQGWSLKHLETHKVRNLKSFLLLAELGMVWMCVFLEVVEVSLGQRVRSLVLMIVLEAI